MASIEQPAVNRTVVDVQVNPINPHRPQPPSPRPESVQFSATLLFNTCVANRARALLLDTGGTTSWLYYPYPTPFYQPLTLAPSPTNPWF